jgi:hypothetical protein
MRQKALNNKKRKPLLQIKKIRISVILFLTISNLLATFGFIWSILPIPMQSSTIQLPDTFTIGSDKELYQFPLKRDLMVTYPDRIRYGDVQQMHLTITPKIDPTKCDEFCQEKHLTYENIWSAYKVNMVFSFDLNNLIMEPMGETTYPLAKSSTQEFIWKITVLDNKSGYMKNTIFLQFIPFDSNESNEQLVFARELTIPVAKAGPFSFPIFRIICVVWVLTSILWLLLNHRTFRSISNPKMM